MTLRMLVPEDAAAFHSVRLQALRECPTAFTSSYEEERDRPLSVVAERLAPTPDSAVFGAVEEGRIAGMVGIRRETPRKLAHKAFIWGMYVAADYRRRGLGRDLLKRALAHAAGMPGLMRVTLGVNAKNPAALALYRKAGFEQYCVERGFLLVDGVLHDEIQMGLSIGGQGHL